MFRSTRPDLGLDLVLEAWAKRYVFDAQGRLLRGIHEGVLPRFVLGRSHEGCVWRFRAGLEPELIRAVANLCGRETGIPTGCEPPIPPPERLVMIERLLRDALGEGADWAGSDTRYEILWRDGRLVGELWSVA